MTFRSAEEQFDWFGQLSHHPAMERLILRAQQQGGRMSARGIVGSSAHLTAAALATQTGNPVLLVVAHLDDADEAGDELNDLGVDAARFPAIEMAAGEINVSLDLVGERFGLIRRLTTGQTPQVIIAPIQALMQALPPPQRIDEMMRVLRPGDHIDVSSFGAWLTDAGYSRVEAIESPGEFAVRGGIIDLFPPGSEPMRFDLFGDEIEQINIIDLDSMGSDRRLDEVQLVAATLDQLQNIDEPRLLLQFLPQSTIAVLVEMVELTEQGRSYFDRTHDGGGISGPPAVFQSIAATASTVIELNQYSPAADEEIIELPTQPLPTFSETVGEAVGELGELAADCRVIVCCQNQGERQRLEELLHEHNQFSTVEVADIYIHRGFVWHAPANASADVGAIPSLAIVPYHELVHRYHTRRRVRRVAGSKSRDAFLDLQPGDYVVHRDHGIARFVGLQQMSPKKSTGTKGKQQPPPAQEYLTLEFARGAKLHVPASKLELIQKYIGAYRGSPELSTLGGRKWKAQKEKVSESVRDLAAEMLRVQAARAAMPGVRYPEDTKWQLEFEAEFPYQETEDQLAAIAAVKRDLSNMQPMDRLLCGDVGFGKTEVAIRAAFKVAEYGKQVAVLVPTTVLAEQHERTFHERFAGYPFRIESMSRFKTAKEQREVLSALRAGQVDVVIGTHRLLSKDVKFSDLGLVVVDEEQRFGVEHKQRLLEFRATVDVLTMTATPIPRTLHMAMLGLRDISSLSTPPLDRRAIVTEVMHENPRRIRQAIERELAREGQVFFVHNRVHDIDDVAEEVRQLVPDAEIIIGHGQMPARQLESVMLKFVRRQADVLVCTTIIESGIDIPTANTMIIHDAHMYGLSELHQLRGRVGRYKHRAYCYLTLPTDRTVSETAVKRLRAIESFSMLGAGFKIAMRDLEIRGAGNLLGAEQSGHIAAVGYEMYCQLLEHAVDELKDRKTVATIDTTIDIGITGSLPAGFIPSVPRRLDAYRRISQANDLATLSQVEEDLKSAYGDLPTAARLLIELAELRISAAHLGISTIQRHDGDVIFKTRKPDLLEQHLGSAKGTLRVVGQPDAAGHATVYYRPPKSYFDGMTLLNVLRGRLRRGDHATAQTPAGV